MQEDDMIKVKITEKVLLFEYLGHNYRPGDTVTIPSRLLACSYMEVVSPVKQDETKKVEPTKDDVQHTPDKTLKRK